MIFLVVTHYRENEMEKIKRFLYFFLDNLIELEGKRTLTVLLLNLNYQYKPLDTVSVPSQHCRCLENDL